jgi:hypothetical protein
MSDIFISHTPLTILSNMYLTPILLAFIYHSVQCLRLAILADVHLNETVDLDSPHLGVYGEDSKMKLFEVILDDLNANFHQISHLP